MIFAGISLATAPLFTGKHGDQWRKRTQPVNLRNYVKSDESDMTEFTQLVAAFERLLPLPLHEAGFLERHADYLFERTMGSIASLSDLITEAAADAIDEGVEAITLDVLDNVSVGDEDLWDRPTSRPTERESGDCSFPSSRCDRRRCAPTCIE
jgi:hypothetical protein